MKVAACFSTDSIDCHAAVNKMTQAMQLREGQRPGSFRVSGGALGYVTSSDRFSSIRLFRKAANENLLMISGVPIDLHESLDDKLQDILEGDYREACEALPSLDGGFAAFFWDSRNQKLVTVTDALGLQPLYVSQRGSTLLLATELKAFSATGLINVAMEPAGWGAFISLGFNIGDHTQLASVRRAESATFMVYDPITGSLDSSVYWRMPKPKPMMNLADVDLGEMLRIMRQEIQCYASYYQPGTVLLSGGFDSRLILTLLKQANMQCKSLTLTHPEHGYGIDGKYAVKIAQRLNCGDTEQCFPSKDYYSSPSYLRYLVLDEVVIPSMVLYMSTHVSESIRPEMKAVWEGLGPGFAFAPSYPRTGGFSTYLQDRCKGLDTPQWQAALSVFSNSQGQAMYESFQQLLDREIAKYTDDDYGTARFQMANQMRGYLAPSPFTVYANDVIPFTPGLSKELWNLAGSIPLSVTSNMKLYLKLFEDHLPAALGVPICSGGKLLSHRAFTPDLWTRGKLNSLGKSWRYHWRRLPRVPVVGPTLERLGLVGQAVGERNALLDSVVRLVPPDSPGLNADTVCRLQSAEPPYSWSERLGRRMLFYCQTWRWVMDGRLTTWNAENFVEQEHAKSRMNWPCT